MRRGIPIYLVALLLMAWTGSVHRDAGAAVRRADARLAALRTEITALRAEASKVRGPRAVAAWALGAGMVPSTDVVAVEHVMPFPAPDLEVGPPSGLEVTTTWR